MILYKRNLDTRGGKPKISSTAPAGPALLIAEDAGDLVCPDLVSQKHTIWVTIAITHWYVSDNELKDTSYG